MAATCRRPDRLSGLARRLFAIWRAGGLSGDEARCPAPRSRTLSPRSRGPGAARHDPDREFGRRPGGRHPSPAAGIGPAHHRRALPAGESPAARAQGRDSSTGSRPCTATCMRLPMPQVLRELGLTPVSTPTRRAPPRSCREKDDRTKAAIASDAGRRDLRSARSCAITSRTRTTTRRASWSWREDADRPGAGSGPVVTSFVFRVRNMPAALYKALGGFATNGVNMTKLESYMIDGQFVGDAVLRRYRGTSGSDAGAPGVRGARASSAGK